MSISKKQFLVLCASVLITGCGGGDSPSGVIVVPAPTPNPTPTPAPAPAPTPTPTPTPTPPAIGIHRYSAPAVGDLTIADPGASEKPNGVVLDGDESLTLVRYSGDTTLFPGSSLQSGNIVFSDSSGAVRSIPTISYSKSSGSVDILTFYRVRKAPYTSESTSFTAAYLLEAASGGLSTYTSLGMPRIYTGAFNSGTFTGETVGTFSRPGLPAVRFLGRVTTTINPGTFIVNGTIDITQFAPSTDMPAPIRIKFQLERGTPGSLRTITMTVTGLGPSEVSGSLDAADYSGTVGGSFRAESGGYSIVGGMVAAASEVP